MKWGPVAAVMCGGRGRRMGGVEKALVKVGGKPLIEYTIDALLSWGEATRIEFITSIHTPGTVDFLRSSGFNPFIASGSGFAADLSEFLSTRGRGEYLVVSCDIPALKPIHIKSALEQASTMNDNYVIFVIPFEKVRGLSKKPTIFKFGEEEYQPAGLRFIRKHSWGEINLTNPRPSPLYFRELAINVNTLADVEIAEKYLTGMLGCLNC